MFKLSSKFWGRQEKITYFQSTSYFFQKKLCDAQMSIQYPSIAERARQFTTRHLELGWHLLHEHSKSPKDLTGNRHEPYIPYNSMSLRAQAKTNLRCFVEKGDGPLSRERMLDNNHLSTPANHCKYESFTLSAAQLGLAWTALYACRRRRVGRNPVLRRPDTLTYGPALQFCHRKYGFLLEKPYGKGGI